MRISDWSSDVCSSDLPAIGGAALLDDPMKGTVPLVVAKLRARAHHRNQYAAGFQEAEGMADMIAVAAPVKERVHDDAVIEERRGKRKEGRLPHRGGKSVVVGKTGA